MTKIKSRGIIKPVNQLKSKNTHNIYHKPWLPFFPLCFISILIVRPNDRKCQIIQVFGSIVTQRRRKKYFVQKVNQFKESSHVFF